jgi:hypothetical protein
MRVGESRMDLLGTSKRIAIPSTGVRFDLFSSRHRTSLDSGSVFSFKYVAAINASASYPRAFVCRRCRRDAIPGLLRVCSHCGSLVQCAVRSLDPALCKAATSRRERGGCRVCQRSSKSQSLATHVHPALLVPQLTSDHCFCCCCRKRSKVH